MQNNVLIDFGAAKGNLVKGGEVYRLITASFLHVNLLHITMNSISILLFVSRFEKIYGWQTPLVLLVASITGTPIIMQDSCSACYATKPISPQAPQLPSLEYWAASSPTSSSTGLPYNRGVLTAVFGWVCDWWDCAHRRDDWRAADFAGCAAGDAVEERSDKVLRVGGDSGDEYDNLPGFLSHLMMSMLSLFILLFILNSTRV